MNEGHSAFLAIERIRVLMAEQGLSFEEALHAARANNVFTTHTSVPAGHRPFRPGPGPRAFRALLPEGRHCAGFFSGSGPRRRRRVQRTFFDGRLRHADFRLSQRRQPAAPPGFAGNVGIPVARPAGVGSSDRRHHQRRAPHLLDQRRPGQPLRSAPAARLARGQQRARDLAADRRHPRRANCGKPIAAASAAWWLSFASAPSPAPWRATLPRR